MKNLLLVTVILLGSTKLWSQDKVNLIVKFHPLNLFSSARPYVQGSAELLFLEHVGIEVGYGRRYGYDVAFAPKPDSLIYGRNGRNILVEVYYREAFIKVVKRDWGLYDFVGLTYRSVLDERNLQLDYHDFATGEDGTDYYGLKTTKDAWALRWGLQVLYKRLVLEGFVEAGWQTMSKTEFGFDDTKDHYTRYILFTAKEPYDGFQYNLNAGIKVGFKLF